VAENFITLDTETLTAQANEHYLTVSGDIALKARRYNGLKLPEASARKLMLLQQTLMLPDADDRASYARLAASMTGAYGKAKYCPSAAAGAAKPDCMPLGELEKVLATSHDPARLKEVWLGWHAQSPAYKHDYAKYVELSNKGARAMGFADTGALWRSRYDMSAGCLLGRDGTPVAAGQAAVRLAAHLHPLQAAPGLRSGWCRPTARYPRTCWAICGRRAGTTCTRS
jgi:peptidyl-dipeptidase A